MTSKNNKHSLQLEVILMVLVPYEIIVTNIDILTKKVNARD